MRATGGKGESASLLLGVRGGLFLRLGRVNIGLPANFGRFRGPNGPAGGAFAPVEGRETAGDVAGGVAADGWRLWCWPHWRQPAVSPTRKGGGSASSARPGKGGEVPVQPDPERGGNRQFRRWRSSAAGGFEVGLSGVNAAWRSCSRSAPRRWRRAGSIGSKRVCGEVWDSSWSAELAWAAVRNSVCRGLRRGSGRAGKQVRSRVPRLRGVGEEGGVAVPETVADRETGAGGSLRRRPGAPVLVLQA